MPNPWDDLPPAAPTPAVPAPSQQPAAPQAGAGAMPWDDLPLAATPAGAVSAVETSPRPAETSLRDLTVSPTAQISPDEAETLRLLVEGGVTPGGVRAGLEMGVPMLAASLLGPFGPPARVGLQGLAALAPQAQALLTRAVMMALASAIGSEAGEIVDPSDKSAEDHARRLTNAMALGGSGEAAGSVVGLAIAPRAAPALRTIAENQGAKALGFLFSALQRTGREEARRIARIGLDERVFRGLGVASPETLLQRAEALQLPHGARLGRIRAEMDALGPGASTDDIIANIRRDLGADIVSGESDEALLRSHLNKTTQDVRAYAQQGAADAPVLGPEGNRAFWEMSPTELNRSIAMTPHFGPGQSAGSDILRAHAAELAAAIRAGHLAPTAIPADFLYRNPELAELFPAAMNATSIGKLKGKFAARAYGETGRVPETLMGQFAPRTETARRVLQEAEDQMASSSLTPARAREFQRSKDVYGAMERLVDAKTGVTEAAANRHLGNNQVFGLTSQLSGLSGRTPFEGGLFALLTRPIYTRGNQFSATNVNRIAEALAKVSPRAASLLGQLLAQSASPAAAEPEGLGVSSEEWQQISGQ